MIILFKLLFFLDTLVVHTSPPFSQSFDSMTDQQLIDEVCLQ